MYNVALASVTLLAFFGIILMEMGAFGEDVGYGYPNNASIAYGVHLIVLFGTYFVVFRHWVKRKNPELPSQSNIEINSQDGHASLQINKDYAFHRLGYFALSLQFIIFLIVLFVLGAIDVMMHNVGKGEFRSSFGKLGPFAYMLRDFLSPTICALVAVSFVAKRGKDFKSKVIVIANLLMAMGPVFVWGYRSSAIYYLLPALIFLFPVMRLKGVALFGLVALFLMTLTHSYFEGTDFYESVGAISNRAVVGNGNAAWKVWDLYAAGETLPSYWPTLASCLGNNIASAVGLGTRVGDRSYEYDFSSMVTWIVKDFSPGVDARTSNVTATSFSGGVIAFGSPGFLIFSFISGLAVAINRILLKRATERKQLATCAVLANYYAMGTLSFVNGGDFASVFGIWIVFNTGIAYLVCRFFLHWSAFVPEDSPVGF